MARQDDRRSDTKRHRSRSDQEPSPKRSRRDGKPTGERPPPESNLDSRSRLDPEQRRQRPESPRVRDSKVESKVGSSKESDKKSNGHQKGTKRSSYLTEVPRSQSSYNQHDERGNGGQVGRSSSRRGGADSRDEHRERPNRTTANDTRRKDENTKAGHGKDNHPWRHDRYFEMEADTKPPMRKRPAFSEQKIPSDSGKSDKAAAAAAEPQKLNHSERHATESTKKDERPGHGSRPSTGEMEEAAAARRGKFSSVDRDRYGGGNNNYGRRDGFTPRQDYPSSGRGRVQKWKHDLYHEANRSPTPKNEEDQIAKVEALLSS